MTVADCLTLPALRRGLPEVVAGASHLSRPIRWAHAGEVPNIASLLSGGELLLTTGMGIGARRGQQRSFIARLAERSVAALVVELGATLPILPTSLIEAAREHDLPLVALHREVAFVSVTEAIHTELVNRRYALLSRSDEIAHRLSQILLDGGGVPEIMQALARALHNAVFLEDGHGRLLYHADFESPSADEAGSHEAGAPGALDAWHAAQALLGRDPRQAGLARPVPFGAGAAPPGRLLVLPVHSSLHLHALAEAATERAADIIALALLQARQEELLARQRGNLLADLGAGRIAGEDAARQARLIGFTGTGTFILPLAAEAAGAPPVQNWNTALHEIQSELRSRGLCALVGPGRHAGTVLAAIDTHSDADRDETAQIAAQTIRTGLSRRLGEVDVTIAVGRPVAWTDAGPALALAGQSAASARPLARAPWHDVDSLELQRLLWHWRDDDAMADFIERALGPLLAHDRRRSHRLIPTLQALCANGGRKAETARVLSLNRQALYRRLQRIEELLQVDLDDPETMLTLHLALRAHACIG